MAMSRYEERKSYEVLETNAISTEYLRADLVGDGCSQGAVAA